MFQDIDGDIGGAYARVSLHPTGPYRKIAHPLNVDESSWSLSSLSSFIKNTGHPGARKAVKWHFGLGHALCSTSLLIDIFAKEEKKTKGNKIHDSEEERGREREKRKRERE